MLRPGGHDIAAIMNTLDPAEAIRVPSGREKYGAKLDSQRRGGTEAADIPGRRRY